MFAVVNVMVQDVTVRSQMYTAVVERYTSMPYKYNPEKTYDMISIPQDLYTWLRRSFVPVTFSETRILGEENGFCTEGHKCYIDQGDCDSDNQCQGNLSCADKSTLSSGYIVKQQTSDTGTYWDRDDLMRWCQFMGTPLIVDSTGKAVRDQTAGDNGCTLTPSLTDGKKGPCCWDKSSDKRIARVLPANSGSSKIALVAADFIGRSNCPSNVGPTQDCCVPSSSDPYTVNQTAKMQKLADGFSPRPVTMGNFNRILMVRFTVKRFKQTTPTKTNAVFAHLAPQVLSGGGNALDGSIDNGKNEDKTSFSGMDLPTAHQYIWDKPNSAAKAGGYVEYINPAKGESHFGTVLERLWLDGLFDKRLAVFTVDMLLYNGNTETFMYANFQFNFDPSGSCAKTTWAMFAKISGGMNFALGAEYFFLIPCVVGFLIWEFKKMREVSLAAHFTAPNSWIDMLSLTLCIAVLCMNWVIRYNTTSVNFKFIDNPEGFSNKEEFLGMLDLQSLIATQVYFVSINLLMIFFRAIVQITSLDGNLGLIINTLGVSMVNIMYFSMTFLFLLIGFVAFAFFTFGSNPRDSGFYSPLITFYRTFAMLLGQQNFEGLQKADPLMAMFFFFAFYIMVLFVMLNMFISILLSGYDICDFELKNKKKEESLVKKIIDDLKVEIFGKISTKLFACVGGLWGMCLKPFFVGITSCFMDCLKSCDCGIRCPPISKLCAVCCICLAAKPDTPEKLEKDMGKEKKRKDRLLKRSKKLIRTLESKDPSGAENLKRVNEGVVSVFANYEKREQDDKEQGGEAHVVTIEEIEPIREQNTLLEEALEELEEEAGLREKLCMLSFMGVFVLMLITMTRGEDTYWVNKATLDPAIGETWVVQKPMRLSGFKDIDSMDEVGEWAQTVLATELYANPHCRHDGTIPGYSIDSDIPWSMCNNVNDTMQKVQRLNTWNIGFLNTTFVRVTIQPACFVANKESRWKAGSPYLRSKAMADSCAGASCYVTAKKKEGTCHDSAGEVINEEKYPASLQQFSDASRKSYYNFSKAKMLGAYSMLGGFVVSLGNSLEEAESMLATLTSDLWFSKNSASIVFDWITYNGNLDMFTYNVISFSLLKTGTLLTEQTTRTFPLNIQDGGGPFHASRLMIMILFIIYVLQVAYFIGLQIFELADARAKSARQKQRFYYFFFAYYKSLWNRIDTMSLVITVISLVVYFGYMTDVFREEYKFSFAAESRYQVPPAAVKLYKIVPQVDTRRALEDDWYIFSQFENVAGTYALYLNLAAVNAFFIAVKVVKYANKVEAFKIYARTLAEGSERMMYFSVVIGLLLTGWSLFFLILFGVYDSRLSDIFSALTTCFTWILGDFDLDKMLAAREFAAIIFFILFELMMYFICINMFLATMLNAFSDSVGKLEVQAEKDRIENEREHSYVEVEYKDKEELKGDITIKRDDLGEVWVTDVNPGGIAEKQGVFGGGIGKGNLMKQVNGENQEWKEHATEQEIIEDGIQPDPRDQQIRIVFKAPRLKEKNWLGKAVDKLLNKPDASARWGAGVRPTVKTFWRKHGAVTYTYSEVLKYERNSDEPDEDAAVDEAKDGAGKGDDDGKAEKGAPSGNEMKAVKARTKKKLEGLLFSRAVRTGAPDGMDPFDISHMDNKKGSFDGVAGEEAKVEDESLEIDELRNRIETEAVTGDEVWLDCLMTQIEHEMEDESVVTEVLRTPDMQETHRGQGPAKQDSLNSFYRLVIDILAILECKAKQKWYKCLQEESQQRLDMFKNQNEILHDYACELEAEFADIMEKIHRFKAKKNMMIETLSGLLDKQAYKHLDTTREEPSKKHLERLSIPWPDAMVQNGRAQIGV